MRNAKRTTIWAILGLCLALATLSAGETKITKDQACGIAVGALAGHLRQHGNVDVSFMKRLLSEYAKRMDPFKDSYLQSEVDTLLDKSDGDLAEIGVQALVRDDLAFFQAWMTAFKEKQLVREAEFIKSLRERKADVTKKVSIAEVDESRNKYPTTEEEMHAKQLLIARSTYEAFSAYLPPDEAFDMTMKVIEEALAKRVSRDPATDVPREFLKAFMQALDPHSEYMDADEVASMKDGLAKNFSGIGVQVRPSLAGTIIVDVYKNMPAAKSGQIGVGDQIVGVDGASVTGVPLDKIIRLIKGPRGTEVKLTIRKAAKSGQESQIIVVTLVRDTIEMANVKVRGEVRETPNGRVGYLAIDGFYDGMAADAAAKIRAMIGDKKLAGLVVDLRDNGGGLLREAIAFAGLFIHAGPIVAEKGNGNAVTWDYDPDAGIVFDGPLAILVNQNSASASEVVAGTLSDYGRAVIVGSSQTYGKGTVQMIMDLDSMGIPGMIRLTTKQYFVAKGESVQLNGVAPDVIIPGWKLRAEWLERANDGTIPEGKVEGTISENDEARKYQAIKQKIVPQLVDASKARVATDASFDMYKDEANRDVQKKDALDPQKEETLRIVEDMAKAWPGQ